MSILSFFPLLADVAFEPFDVLDSAAFAGTSVVLGIILVGIIMLLLITIIILAAVIISKLNRLGQNVNGPYPNAHNPYQSPPPYTYYEGRNVNQTPRQE